MATPKKKPASSPEIHAEPTSDEALMARRIEMARRRRAALGSYKGHMSLSLEEAMAPLDEEELAAWGLGLDVSARKLE